MRAIVTRFEERAAGGDAVHESWQAARAAIGEADDDAGTLRLAVLANALTLVHFDTDQDVVDLSRITEEIDHHDLAVLQDELLAPVDTGADRPLTTTLVRTLGVRAWGRPARTPGSLTHDAEVLRALCSEAALRLLMVGRPAAAPARPATAEELLDGLRTGDVLLWRRLVAASLADPWGGARDIHLSGLDPERRPCAFGGVTALVELTRRLAEEDERRDVADHIRRTVASTGLTQRDFATLIGTSPSRLSTYSTGAVTPSAAMLLRINRTARHLRRHARAARRNPA